MRTRRGSSYKVKGKVWLYPGETGNWHFLTVPKKESAAIKKAFGSLVRSWGSFPVSVTIGKTTWKTSIFPDAKSGTYVLPLKAVVRRKEGLFEGDTITFSFQVYP
jgi:hypothetical protein